MLCAERLKCWGWQNSLSELFVSCRSQVFVMFSIVSLQRASVSTVKVGGEVETSAARLIGEVVQSRRRPLLGPSPG